MRAAGLAKVGVIAVDGTKVHANASRNENVDYEQLAREIVEEAKAVDAAEDELYGDARGDELPEQLRDRRGPARVAARGQAALGGRARQRAAAGAAHAARSALKEAKRRLEEELWTEVPRQRRLRALPRRGRMQRRPPVRPRHRIPTRRPRRRRGGSTSPTPTRVSSRGCAGFIQGYNAQAVTNEHQIVIAAEVMTAGAGLRAPGADARRRPARARTPPASPRRPRCCSPTPATGISSRWSASSTAASRS